MKSFCSSYPITSLLISSSCVMTSLFVNMFLHVIVANKKLRDMAFPRGKCFCVTSTLEFFIFPPTHKFFFIRLANSGPRHDFALF